MNTRHRATAGAVAGFLLACELGSHALVGAHSGARALQKEMSATMHARGTFDVKLTPQASDDDPAGALGRTSFDKRLHGDLEGTSKGEMLSALTSVQGSAAYVAIERVNGALDGRRGSFVLQHTGTMARGALQLTVAVVPDSGTGQLVGLTGKMAIQIDGGKHSYDLEYAFTDAAR